MVVLRCSAMERRDTRRLSPAAQEELRRRAVAAVEAGATRTEVGHLLGVPRQTIGKWVQAYRFGGEAALVSKQHGPRRGVDTKLVSWQAAEIRALLRDQRPEQLKLPFYVWTRDAVVELVERRFGVRVSRWTAGRYLKTWGFTPQKPLRRAREQNPQAVAHWLKREYPQDPARGEARRGADLLGRRDGAPVRSHGGALLQSPRADAGGTGYGAALWLQHNQRDQQSRGALVCAWPIT